jgi:hypothetical protein
VHRSAARLKTARDDPRREIALTHRSADRPVAGGRGRANGQVGNTAWQEIAREHPFRAECARREQVHLTRERQIGKERRRKVRRGSHRAAEQRAGRDIRIVFDHRHDRGNIFQDAALDMTKAKCGLRMRVLVARGDVSRILGVRLIRERAGGQCNPGGDNRARSHRRRRS